MKPIAPMPQRRADGAGDAGHARRHAGQFPAWLDAMVTMMSARLDGLKATATAAKSLYAVLDDTQKKTADDLIMSPMGGM